MFRPNYIVIPLVTVAVALIGSWLTSGGMEWYRTLKLMPWTPSGKLIGSVWTVLYILTTISALLVWNRHPRDSTFHWIIGLFVFNAVLNVAWSAIFFRLHWMGVSIAECVILGLTVVALIVLIWPRDRVAASLLIPYAGWVAFATFLNLRIRQLNS